MRIINLIIYYIGLIGFTTSCSIGLYQGNSKLESVGIFLFFFTLLMNTAIEKSKDK